MAKKRDTSTQRRKKGKTIVDDIVTSLCVRIVRGEYEVGVKLPPLRALAKEYGITLPTMQRVVAKLEELGLVHVLQGSGVTVRDPVTEANLSAIPYWIHVVREDPAGAVKLFDDFLDVRRVLGTRLLLGARGRLRERELWGAFDEELARFEHSAAHSRDWGQMCRHDFQLMREFLRVEPQLAYSGILNVFERILMQVPELLEAAYNPATRNVRGWQVVLEVLRDKRVSDEEARRQITGTFRAFDTMTLAKFEAVLRQGNRPGKEV